MPVLPLVVCLRQSLSLWLAVLSGKRRVNGQLQCCRDALLRHGFFQCRRFFPGRLAPAVPEPFLVAILRAFVLVVSVLTSDEALLGLGVTLRMKGSPTAHNLFSVQRGAGQVTRVHYPRCGLDVLQSEYSWCSRSFARGRIREGGFSGFCSGGNIPL